MGQHLIAPTRRFLRPSIRLSRPAAAAHCDTDPSCNVYQWNSANKFCALATYPSGPAANTGLVPVHGYISGSKLAGAW